MNKYEWKDNASCLDYDTIVFFDKYEEDEPLRPAVDLICSNCPVRKECFSVGISGKEWGVWGGVYLENGEISKEFSSHKTKTDWGITWQSLTME
jgi:hypothetical protein